MNRFYGGWLQFYNDKGHSGKFLFPCFPNWQTAAVSISVMNERRSWIESLATGVNGRISGKRAGFSLFSSTANKEVNLHINTWHPGDWANSKHKKTRKRGLLYCIYSVVFSVVLLLIMLLRLHNKSHFVTTAENKIQPASPMKNMINVKCPWEKKMPLSASFWRPKASLGFCKHMTNELLVITKLVLMNPEAYKACKKYWHC